MKHILLTSYIATIFLFVAFSYAFIDPNISYLQDIYTGFAYQQKEVTTAIYVLFVFLFSLFYFLLYRLSYQKRLQINELLWLIGITVGLLLFSYPAMLSYDIFNYLTTAKVAFFYHENPYLVMPIEFNNEPFLSFTRAANKIALYGPAWILLSAIPYVFSFGNFLILLFGFKILVTIFYIGTIYLIWKLTKNYLPIVLFAFNPLVVIETLVSGHNDIVMMFFALFSFYLLKHKKVLLGIVFLTISILIKYATIFLLPVFLFVVWSQLRKQKVQWDTVFTACAGFMFVAFLLSPIREEMYPWYAIWFIAFLALIPQKISIFYGLALFSSAFLLRHSPYMFTGSYLEPTPTIKKIVSFVPLLLFGLYYAVKKKI